MKSTLLIITVAFLFCSSLMAQSDDETSRKSLKGLTGVAVVVEDLQPDAEKSGLSGDQIQTDVELRLRLAGIKVLTQEQMLASPGTPFLEVNLNTLTRQETYSYSLEVRLHQGVSLERNPRISLPAVTWEAGAVGFAELTKSDQIRNHIKDYVDKFINAWLSVNPKH
jgi:hypothetical protein